MGWERQSGESCDERQRERERRREEGKVKSLGGSWRRGSGPTGQLFASGFRPAPLQPVYCSRSCGSGCLTAWLQQFFVNTAGEVCSQQQSEEQSERMFREGEGVWEERERSERVTAPEITGWGWDAERREREEECSPAERGRKEKKHLKAFRVHYMTSIDFPLTLMDIMSLHIHREPLNN